MNKWVLPSRASHKDNWNAQWFDGSFLRWAHENVFFQSIVMTIVQVSLLNRVGSAYKFALCFSNKDAKKKKKKH